MLSAWRRKSTVTNNVEGPTSGSSTQSTELPQWQLDQFNAQRDEHNRLFFQLLDEFFSGPRARQVQFSGFLDHVRSTFTSAQEKRQEQWRAMHKDMRDFTIKLQESCAAQSEGSRDSAVREGLDACNQRAEHFRCKFDTMLQDVWSSVCDTTGHESMLHSDRRAIGSFIEKLRSSLDARSDITLTTFQTVTPPPLLRPETEAPSRTVPVCPLPERSYDASFPYESAVTLADINALEGISVENVGDAWSFKTAFSQLQSERRAIWKRASKRNSHALGMCQELFLSVSSELAAVFCHHPCMNGESDNAVILATTMLVAFRAAESRRALDLQRSWKRHVQDLRALLWRHIWDYKLSEPVPRLRPRRKERAARSEPSSSTALSLPLTPRSLFRRPGTSIPLPVVAAGHQREAFDQEHQERELLFAQAQSKLRQRGQHAETMNQAAFSQAISRWESEAASAELRRNAEFADALERVRTLHESNIARNCNDLALTLDKEFAEAQRFRERTFHDALDRLSLELISICDEFRCGIVTARSSNIELPVDDTRSDEVSMKSRGLANPEFL